MADDAPRFNPGERVQLVSEPDRVGSIAGAGRRVQGEYWYPVTLPDGTNQHPESDLQPYRGALADVASLLSHGAYAGREAFSKLLCHLRLKTALRSQIYSLAASRTDFYPHQFKPLLKLLDSRRHRLLMADEVGLGKTIEAGLILTEFRQRTDLRRVLVVAPSMLLTKWHNEMRTRFALPFEILDSRGVVQFLDRYEDERDEARLLGIVSLQALRSARVRDRWAAVEPEIDLAVFDEAGRLKNRETWSYYVAQTVASSADSVLLLTATPVQTSEEDLFNLLRLLDPEEFADYAVFEERLKANEHVIEASRLLSAGVDLATCAERLAAVEASPLARDFVANPLYVDVLQRMRAGGAGSRRERIELQRDLNGVNLLAHVLNRTRKREAQEKLPVRRANVHRVEPALVERTFYDRITELCQRAYREAGNSAVSAFATMTPQRQVASCMVAMLDYYLDRERRGDAPFSLAELAELSDLDVEDFEFEEEEVSQPSVDLGELGDLGRLRETLEAVDSKWQALREALSEVQREEPDAKIVIFSYFKKTLAYLHRRLAREGVGAVVISGDVKSTPDNPETDLRGQNIERFRTDPAVQVLLSTEVAEEGLDLQFAHVLINYDLPWNPTRVDQRIGRLDRIGQESSHITIINLSMPDTIEDRILNRLYERIGIFESTIGGLEAILGEEIRRLEVDLFAHSLTPEEQDRRISQAADAIERKALETERVEREAPSLLGSDAFFIEEIRDARAKRRYIGGDELRLYVGDFLATRHPTCTVRPGPKDGVFYLRADDQLRTFVRTSANVEDPALKTFLAKSARGEVAFTVDPARAQENRQLEFLTFYHPLVRAVTKYYETHGEELHPVSHIETCSSAIAPGSYAWFLYLIEITGIRPLKDLECMAIDLGTGAVLSEDASETLLAAMLSSSSDPKAGRRREPVPESVQTAAEETLVGRLAARFNERARSNDALVRNQLASLNATFDRNRRLRQERIENARLHNRSETYIKGLETGLRNYEATHRARVAAVEAGRRMGPSYRLQGAGVVEVGTDA